MVTAFRSSLLVAALVIALSACRQNSVQNHAGGNIPVYESQEFQDFYEKFGTDSVYQMEHIVFPLEGMPALQDTSDVIPVDFKWQRESWIMHKPYDDMNGTFTREFIDFKGIVIEKIADHSGRYSMERRFSKLPDGWHLIYYRAMGLSDFN
ncbi:MAG: hypothetical protein IPM26_05765 [Saprospiraceae bacterium]|nr:hypothetical protein [Saprospiraceae bacterium]